MHMLGAVVAILAIVAAADYLFQYRQWFERQKMSLREMKEEFKQTEGDPTVKGKIRQLRQARMRKRMMAAVPKASVIITNPTHFAVALQYERGMNAPVCVAKGIDLIALQNPRGGERSTTSRSSRTRRWPARCTPPSRSTRRSRPSTTRRWPRSSATSCGSTAVGAATERAVTRAGRNPLRRKGRVTSPVATAFQRGRAPLGTSESAERSRHDGTGCGHWAPRRSP